MVGDAIVVVENVEHWIERGLSPNEASHKAMSEVGSALIAATVVLISVFVPTAFIPGITGEFYRRICDHDRGVDDDIADRVAVHFQSALVCVIP
ncbi:MAG: efflux RND transporter permease subunit [Pirellulaceae bacterium]